MKITSLLIIGVLTLLHSPQLPAAEIPSKLKALHVLNRLGFGPRPGDIERVNAMGIGNYIHQQLFPESIPEPPELTQKIKKLKTYSMNPTQLFRKYGPPRRIDGGRLDIIANSEQTKKARIILSEAIQARLMRAIESPRQLQEVMVDFWFNHFNVDAQKEAGHLWVGNYEREAIRPHVMGHFRDLLGVVAKHPAMLFYLDNWLNVVPDKKRKVFRLYEPVGLNENYARELMELHTLGVDGGYTQEDVVALTHIFTGWGYRPHFLDTGNVEFYFNNKRHDNSRQVFFNRTISQRGEREGEEVLDILARSPATARHISFQLAQFFVADDPDPALVDLMAKKFEETDGDIRSVLEVIFESPEFWDEKNYDNKFKTPLQYVISTVRASGEKVTNYLPLIDSLRELGMPLYEYETPDGNKNTQEAWLNPDQMLKRINFAAALAFGKLDINDDKFQIPYEGLMNAFDHHFSEGTLEEVQKAPARLRAMLILGSPDMIKK